MLLLGVLLIGRPGLECSLVFWKQIRLFYQLGVLLIGSGFYFGAATLVDLRLNNCNGDWFWLYVSSHDGDELVLIRDQGKAEVKPLKHLSGQVCQICGDDVGLTTNGDLFVACNVCAFPVCSPCYEYERKARNQSCPQCKTIYKMHKGSAKVEGDEGEEGAEDLGNEYHYPPPRNKNEKKKIALENVLWERGGCWCSNLYKISGEFPALSPEHSLRAPPSSGGGSKRVHPLPYTDAQVRIVDRSRDFNSYGFGNVAWKERVERWKNKQEKNMLQVTNSGEGWNLTGKMPVMDHFAHQIRPIFHANRQENQRKL